MRRRRTGRALRRRYGRFQSTLKHSLTHRGYAVRVYENRPGEYAAVIYSPGGDSVGSRSASSAHGASVKAGLYIDDVLLGGV